MLIGKREKSRQMGPYNGRADHFTRKTKLLFMRRVLLGEPSSLEGGIFGKDAKSPLLGKRSASQGPMT